MEMEKKQLSLKVYQEIQSKYPKGSSAHKSIIRRSKVLYKIKKQEKAMSKSKPLLTYTISEQLLQMVKQNQLNCKYLNITFNNEQKINCNFFDFEIKRINQCVYCQFKQP